MKTENVKFVVFVPESHVQIVLRTMGDAGAGVIGNYTHCTFSTKGIGRFKPEIGAHPHTGEIGKLEEVVEERIETIIERAKLAELIKAIRKVHPYEEIAFDVYPLELLS